MKLESAIRLAENILWKSADKDNMEFTARVSYSQRDAIDKLLEVAREKFYE